ncbi:unnamed protein product [Closterium sp. Naga37s-1]|nr:unnamed protein product [Closterium sp. Naga37s-1]
MLCALKAWWASPFRNTPSCPRYSATALGIVSRLSIQSNCSHSFLPTPPTPSPLHRHLSPSLSPLPHPFPPLSSQFIPAANYLTTLPAACQVSVSFDPASPPLSIPSELLLLAVFDSTLSRDDTSAANFTDFAADAPGGAELASLDATLPGALAELASDPDFRVKPGQVSQILHVPGQPFKIIADVLSARILEKDECAALGMGSYLAVAKDNPPKFIHVTYTSPAAGDGGERGEEKPLKNVALIGKGLTFDSGAYILKSGPGAMSHLVKFDILSSLQSSPLALPFPLPPTSGGYNLKAGPGSIIHLMKFDMGDTAAALGTAKAIAAIQPPGVEVHFIIAACKNVVSGGGMKPGNIITASNGKTIEGRTLLALPITQPIPSSCSPSLFFSSPTLPPLLHPILPLPVPSSPSPPLPPLPRPLLPFPYAFPLTGLFTPSDELSAELEASSKASGDKFVAEGLPWAHVDIAGPVCSEKKGGGTGFGASLLYHWVASHSS